MAWEENSCICLNMQLIAILSRIGVVYGWEKRRNSIQRRKKSDFRMCLAGVNQRGTFNISVYNSK